jgi:nucleotide-binding universal stress UspA family protein
MGSKERKPRTTLTGRFARGRADWSRRSLSAPLVAEGQAGEVLLRMAKGADLLVVGCLGHSAFRAPLVGSVSLHCVLHAHCPVMVLRDGHD